jgi:hypothetical protein
MATILAVFLLVGCAKATPTVTPSPTPTPVPTSTPTPTPEPMPSETDIVGELALAVGKSFVEGDYAGVHSHMLPSYQAACDPEMFTAIRNVADANYPVLAEFNRETLECRVSDVRVEGQRAWVDIDVYQDGTKVIDLVTMTHNKWFQQYDIDTHFFENRGGEWYVYDGASDPSKCVWVRMGVEQRRILAD